MILLLYIALFSFPAAEQTDLRKKNLPFSSHYGCYDCAPHGCLGVADEPSPWGSTAFLLPDFLISESFCCDGIPFVRRFRFCDLSFQTGWIWTQLFFFRRPIVMRMERHFPWFYQEISWKNLDSKGYCQSTKTWCHPRLSGREQMYISG